MMKRLPHLFRSLLPLLWSRYTVFFLFLLGYTNAMEQRGGFPSLLPAWRFEIPLLLYLYFFGNLVTRKSRWQAVIVAAPIVLCYAIFDVYHFQLGRMPRIIEVMELPELLAILPFWLKAVLIGTCTIPLLIFLWNMSRQSLKAATLAALPLAALAIAVEWYPEAFMAAFEATQNDIVFYSDVKSTGNNGRISMALYNEARRKSMLARTAQYRDNPFYLMNMNAMIAKIKGQQAKRNVHLIVLESFLDPELLRSAKFSRRPTHPEFEKLFKHKGGLSISPIFGGGTGQAEFELLCGVPAMGELSGVEFDVFTGAPTTCLPTLLSEAGYHTMATNAYWPDFYNSTNAYEGVGFAKAYYPQEYAPGRESYFSTGDVSGEDYMFDGDLLRHNLEFVTSRLRKHPGSPMFNYVLGMYGHTPHDINTEKRPLVVTISGGPKDEELEREINQYYYRTQAIAAFVKELVRIDPKSLIILVSDHLPPLENGPSTYATYNYLGKKEDYLHLNRIFFMENGHSVEYNTIHHYEVPGIILDYITRSPKGRKGTFDPASYHNAYLTIMAQAMNIKKLLPLSNPAPAAEETAPRPEKKNNAAAPPLSL